MTRLPWRWGRGGGGGAGVPVRARATSTFCPPRVVCVCGCLFPPPFSCGLSFVVSCGGIVGVTVRVLFLLCVGVVWMGGEGGWGSAMCVSRRDNHPPFLSPPSTGLQSFLFFILALLCLTTTGGWLLFCSFVLFVPSPRCLSLSYWVVCALLFFFTLHLRFLSTFHFSFRTVPPLPCRFLTRPSRPTIVPAPPLRESDQAKSTRDI